MPFKASSCWSPREVKNCIFHERKKSSTGEIRSSLRFRGKLWGYRWHPWLPKPFKETSQLSSPWRDLKYCSFRQSKRIWALNYQKNKTTYQQWGEHISRWLIIRPNKLPKIPKSLKRSSTGYSSSYCRFKIRLSWLRAWQLPGLFRGNRIDVLVMGQRY